MILKSPLCIVFLLGGLLLLGASCAGTTEDTPAEPLVLASDRNESSAALCVSTECPAPHATCPGVPGLCTTDLSRDVLHCGACDTPCPALGESVHANPICAGGTCTLACQAFFADCNHVLADGCETSTFNDPKNCGFCGNACKEGVLCWKGACGCPNGFTRCGDDCKKLDEDSDNCGACGKACGPPKDPTDPAWVCGPGVAPTNTTWTCHASTCSLSCAPFFGDCNDQFCADGCETDVFSDPSNCGACGHKCAADQRCVNGDCLCPPGSTRCGTECVNLQNNPRHCGACGTRCPGPASVQADGTGNPVCENSKCSYVCFPGFADCDGAVKNGCEVNLKKDPLHCGSCTTPCKVAAGQPCVEGQCLTKPCEPGVIR